ncbi:hypothetical protein DPMN_041309 [Dreissena polymorpha]|uniref:Uncharacterized protein n=1 Tax=Dreissena polymorpha TaxID=45954 RepID=A0A9D4HVZ5_DREPO|nr:hypothetical protein DPMN_041309 [Dreissena polymorpha]
MSITTFAQTDNTKLHNRIQQYFTQGNQRLFDFHQNFYYGSGTNTLLNAEDIENGINTRQSRATLLTMSGNAEDIENGINTRQSRATLLTMSGPPASQPASQPARIRQSNNQFFPSENLVKNCSSEERERARSLYMHERSIQSTRVIRRGGFRKSAEEKRQPTKYGIRDI